MFKAELGGRGLAIDRKKNAATTAHAWKEVACANPIGLLTPLRPFLCKPLYRRDVFETSLRSIVDKKVPALSYHRICLESRALLKFYNTVQCCIDEQNSRKWTERLQ